MIPRPRPVMAMRMSTWLAVAQKMVQTSGTALSGFSTLTGNPSLSRITNECPAPIASEALQRIAELYEIEKDIRGRGSDERCAVRQERTRPLLVAFEPWLREKLALISQKTKLAEAIRYALSRWEGLTRFLDDGRVEIDSNVVERVIRPIALNRKNALFAGSDGGGENWATVASLIETCKLNDVDPQAWLAHVLAKLPDHPAKQIAELLPWNWKASQKPTIEAAAA